MSLASAVPLRRVHPEALRAGNDPREVVADPHARYSGAELGERALVPGDGATRRHAFEEWQQGQSTAMAGRAGR